MGAAKRRGTREQRVAQAIERRKAEDQARRERFQRDEAERLAKLTSAERKEALFVAGGGHRHHLALMGLLGVALAAPSRVLLVDGPDDNG